MSTNFDGGGTNFDGSSVAPAAGSDNSVLGNLRIRRDKVALELAELVSKPDYSIDGQSVQWTAYKASLYKELTDLQELINMFDPYEIRSIVQ